MAFVVKVLAIFVMATIFLHVALALELMDDLGFGNEDEVHHLDEESSAEVPGILTGYTRDTIAHFNPRKADAGFRQLWERVPPLQKVDVIKRR
ncbi:uncharacterized protein LOC108104955 [Drosophila eugracilis]|uniref:uncharacterized protein LOC108104955 n=1 Tax=Drosophila eugracilis TaxID=29029 RepID=UPI0007E81275|nr:uncharacterized protein LOC108104955 [Drosophila eugracilis]